MKIGIIGSRSRNSLWDHALVESNFLKIYKKGYTIVSGGCPLGGDRFAEAIAKKFHVPIKIHYPEWKKYGRYAGFYRNTLIAQDADILIACVSTNRKGGAEDTIKKYLKLGKHKLYLI